MRQGNEEVVTWQCLWDILWSSKQLLQVIQAVMRDGPLHEDWRSSLKRLHLTQTLTQLDDFFFLVFFCLRKSSEPNEIYNTYFVSVEIPQYQSEQVQIITLNHPTNIKSLLDLDLIVHFGPSVLIHSDLNEATWTVRRANDLFLGFNVLTTRLLKHNLSGEAIVVL